jgi:hypothetical protein
MSGRISKEGIDVLNGILAEKRTELNAEQEKRMIEEIERDPDLFDPKGAFNEGSARVSATIPVWVWHYLERRRRVRKSTVSREIAEIVTEFVASELLDLMEVVR